MLKFLQHSPILLYVYKFVWDWLDLQFALKAAIKMKNKTQAVNC